MLQIMGGVTLFVEKFYILFNYKYQKKTIRIKIKQNRFMIESFQLNNVQRGFNLL